MLGDCHLGELRREREMSGSSALGLTLSSAVFRLNAPEVGGSDKEPRITSLRAITVCTCKLSLGFFKKHGGFRNTEN